MSFITIEITPEHTTSSKNKPEKPLSSTTLDSLKPSFLQCLLNLENWTLDFQINKESIEFIFLKIQSGEYSVHGVYVHAAI